MGSSQDFFFSGEQPARVAEDLVDCLSTALLYLDSKGKILFLNSASETLLGYSKTQLAGTSVKRFVVDKALFDDIFFEFKAGQSSSKRMQLCWIILGRGTVELDTTLTHIGGEMSHCVIELVERNQGLQISREEWQADMAAANQALLRNLGHEVKNPLGGIRGAAQLLGAELPETSLREYTQVIIKEADRLKALVDRILFPTETKTLKTPVNIHELTDRVKKLIVSEFGGGTAIKVDYDVSIPEVICDSTQIVQVLLNILRNAAQALKNRKNPQIIIKTRIARQITLRRKRYPLALQVAIKDNGPGIPEDIKSQVFYPLVSGTCNGHGIGLTVAQKIVHAHGGLIDCVSRPGLTQFVINLPLTNGKLKYASRLDS
ncbi:MAG: hypothetical protein CBC42_00045 [Betaproteobacteria bacterium TMED82]|nr:MAG: hypothetical protein CBC42_00045 [Betaproteobacteria bacterium TMED82]